MRTVLTRTLGVLALVALVSLPTQAIGPVDGEVGAIWWDNDYGVNVGGLPTISDDAGAPGFRAELWMFKRYGLRAQVFQTDPQGFGTDSSDSTSVDFVWKAFAPTENNFFGVSGGWQDMDLASLGLASSTSGARIGIEGRISLAGAVYAYAQGSYMPELDDATDPLLAITLQDVSGHEYEGGISWKMFPFVSMRAGYRVQKIDFSQSGVAQPDGDAEARGFLLGFTFRF